ncbi:MAG: hypothetical protein H7834_16685, partial [Magnetococcus sp. YQC-9]
MSCVLADEDPGWQPTEYQYELWGTRQSYRFTSVKLIDYPPEALEHSTNPFAMVTLAHIQAKQTRHRPEARYSVKRDLIRSLRQKGFNHQQLFDLLRFIDWVLHLPKALSDRLMTEITTNEEDQPMPYITSFERIGHERGMEEGMLARMQLGEQKGLQKGRQKGRQEGEAAVLIRQLQR